MCEESPFGLSDLQGSGLVQKDISMMLTASRLILSDESAFIVLVSMTAISKDANSHLFLSSSSLASSSLICFLMFSMSEVFIDYSYSSSSISGCRGFEGDDFFVRDGLVFAMLS